MEGPINLEVMMKLKVRLLSPEFLFAFVVLLPSFMQAQDKTWTARWLARVSPTQVAQPHWMTPIATVTPRLEQEFRFDSLHEVTSSGDVTNFDGGKGLELIPSRHTELLINLPPYLMRENAKSAKLAAVSVVAGGCYPRASERIRYGR